MQNFTDQAEKNGVILYDKGRCQFCGADFQKGVFECMDNSHGRPDLLDFNNPENHVFKFLSVDAHALQHPEIHGRWSNHFHLTRLHLILDKKQKWDYKKSSLLSDYLNEYKSNVPDEFLTPPKPLERGQITTKDLTRVSTANECTELITGWAKQVYAAWKPRHSIVSKIAESFLKRNS